MHHFSAKIRVSMDIAAYLHPNLLAHLTVVAGAAHRIIGTDSWENLSLKVRTQPIDLAVLDPMADGTVRPGAIQSVLDEFPSVPVILYARLSPENLQATVDLARSGVRQVVLYRYDDAQQRFLELIESQPGAAIAQMLLDRLDVPLAAIGPNLRRGVERMFGAPGHFRTVPDLARSAITSARSIYRKFEEAGFASPRKFLVAARLMRAYAYMLEPGNSVEMAGSKLGFDSIGFRRQVKIFFDATPFQVKRTVSPEQLVERLAEVLYPGPGDNTRH
jgi:AraC-like DNA-binding protein